MIHCPMCIFKDCCDKETKHECDMINDETLVLADAIAILRTNVRDVIIDIQRNETLPNPEIDRSLEAVDYICSKIVRDEYIKKFNGDKEIVKYKFLKED